MARTKTIQQPLVFSRREVRQLLGCSLTLVRSLESQGKLRPIVLGLNSRRGVRYRREEVLALVQGAQSQHL